MIPPDRTPGPNDHLADSPDFHYRPTAARRYARQLRLAAIPFNANDNLFEALADAGYRGMTAKGLRDHLLPGVCDALKHLLEALVIDTENDHNTQQTAERVSRMLMDEVFAGRFQPDPVITGDITSFPNVRKHAGLNVVGPLTFRSACSHHLVPIIGQYWVGFIPGDKVLGLSKFARLGDWVFNRPQIQEEAAEQYADLIEKAIEPKGLGIVIKAHHMCMCWRGIKETPDAAMTTSVMRGSLMDDTPARAELLSLINQSTKP